MNTLTVKMKTDQEKAEEIIRDGTSKGLSREEIAARVIEECVEIVAPPGIGRFIKVDRKQMINRDGVNMDHK